MGIKGFNWKKVGLTVLGLGLAAAGSLVESKKTDNELKDLVDKAVTEKLSESSTK